MRLKRITLCVALAIAPNAFAEEATLPEVVVTAPAMEEPLVVTTDPRKPRQPIPAQDGAEYLKTIPGFSVIRKGGTDGDPVFRGMAGSRLNILLDGEQILGGCGGRMDPPTAYIFPSSYDKITVLKGPQTVLYGPGTSAGTILFERASPRRSETGMGFEGSVTAGSFGRTDVMADVRGGSPLVYGRGIYTNSKADDYSDGNGVSVHSRYSRWSANAAVGLTPNENTLVELSMARSDGEAAYADRAVDGVKFARENTGIKAEWKNPNQGTLEKLETQLYRNYIDHVMDSYSMRPGNPAAMMAAMNPDRDTNGGKLVGTLNVSESAQVKLGVDMQSNVHTARSGAAPGYMGDYALKPRIEDANFSNRGVFGEAAHQLDDQSRLIAGLRADKWEAQDTRTMLMIGMTSQMNPTATQTRNETLKSGFLRYEREVMDTAATVYAGVGHAERFPDYWELIGGNKESATTLSAFNTLPEKTTQLDAGVTYRRGNVSASLSGFYSKVADFILIQSNVDKGTVMMPRLATITRNINAHTWGGEGNVAWKLAESWKLDASLAYVRGKNETDASELAQIAPLESRFGATYDNGVWTVGGLLRAVAAQDRYIPNQGNIAGQDIGRTAGFSVLSLNAGYRVSKGVLVSAGVDNLTDRAYAEHLSRAGAMVSGFTQTTRVNETGRNFWLKANFKFD